MPKADDLPGSDRGQSDHDPVTGLLFAMRDAWLTLATANRQGFSNSGGAAADMPGGGQRGSVITELVLPMGHAAMIATNRSISYWLNLAQILGNYQATSIQALGGEAIDGSEAGSERLVAVDEARALLREVGDLATREARLLQSEFGMLAESLAQSLQASDQSGSYRRRWRSKI